MADKSDNISAVFLDRDGTLNVEGSGGPILTPEALALYPGVARSVVRLNEARIPAVLVTNQSVIGRGLLSADQLGDIHNKLKDLLAEEGAFLDAIYYCPHSPDPEESTGKEPACGCRKPGSGMLLQAAQELGLNLSNAYFVGDDRRDMVCARRVCTIPVLVRTGKGEKMAALIQDDTEGKPAFIAKDLPAAVEWILEESRRQTAEPQEGACK